MPKQARAARRRRRDGRRCSALSAAAPRGDGETWRPAVYLVRWARAAGARASARATAQRPIGLLATCCGCSIAPTASRGPRRVCRSRPSAATTAGAMRPPTATTIGPCAFPIAASAERLWRADRPLRRRRRAEPQHRAARARRRQRDFHARRQGRLRADRGLHRARGASICLLLLRALGRARTSIGVLRLKKSARSCELRALMSTYRGRWRARGSGEA